MNSLRSSQPPSRLLAIITLWLLTLPAFAQHEHMRAPRCPSAFAQAMPSSMDRMDKDMMTAPMIGDPDHDFAAMMIPHHQGAVDMARVVLLHGKDPVLRRLA